MNCEYFPIPRRQLLEGTYAAAVTGFLGAFPSQTAFAKAPMLNTQAPYFYRFKLGNFEGTVVSDGTLPQIVPIGASAMLSCKIVKNATLKVYKGAPHGMCTTHKNQVNADLLAFIKE